MNNDNITNNVMVASNSNNTTTSSEEQSPDNSLRTLMQGDSWLTNFKPEENQNDDDEETRHSSSMFAARPPHSVTRASTNVDGSGAGAGAGAWAGGHNYAKSILNDSMIDSEGLKRRTNGKNHGQYRVTKYYHDDDDTLVNTSISTMSTTATSTCASTSNVSAAMFAVNSNNAKSPFENFNYYPQEPPREQQGEEQQQQQARKTPTIESTSNNNYMKVNDTILNHHNVTRLLDNERNTNLVSLQHQHQQQQQRQHLNLRTSATSLVPPCVAAHTSLENLFITNNNERRSATNFVNNHNPNVNPREPQFLIQQHQQAINQEINAGNYMPTEFVGGNPYQQTQMINNMMVGGSTTSSIGSLPRQIGYNTSGSGKGDPANNNIKNASFGPNSVVNGGANNSATETILSNSILQRYDSENLNQALLSNKKQQLLQLQQPPSSPARPQLEGHDPRGPLPKDSITSSNGRKRMRSDMDGTTNNHHHHPVPTNGGRTDNGVENSHPSLYGDNRDKSVYPNSSCVFGSNKGDDVLSPSYFDQHQQIVGGGAAPRNEQELSSLSRRNINQQQQQHLQQQGDKQQYDDSSLQPNLRPTSTAATAAMMGGQYSDISNRFGLLSNSSASSSLVHPSGPPSFHSYDQRSPMEGTAPSSTSSADINNYLSSLQQQQQLAQNNDFMMVSPSSHILPLLQAQERQHQQQHAGYYHPHPSYSQPPYYHSGTNDPLPSTHQPSLISNHLSTQQQLDELTAVRAKLIAKRERQQAENAEQQEVIRKKPFMCLGTDLDQRRLSNFLCFLRAECIEVFKAKPVDVYIRRRSKKIVLDQVGIRCRFCAHLLPRERVGRSSSFPSSLDRIYQSVTMMIREHFSRCREMLPEVREKYTMFRNMTKKGDILESKSYWVESAATLGMVEEDEGITMAGGDTSASAATTTSEASDDTTMATAENDNISDKNNKDETVKVAEKVSTAGEQQPSNADC